MRIGVWISLIITSLALADNTSVFANEKWRRVVNLEGQWKFSIGDNRKWADPSYNDSDWEKVRVPASWEDEGFNGYNGYAWYRRSFDGTLLQNRNDNFTLFMGYIDDVDEVYFNGNKIGSSGSFPPRYHTAYNAERKYFIPKEYINFTGRNVIAVRVYDAQLDGGIVSGNIGISVDDNDKGLVINLRGMWDFALLHRRIGHVSQDKFFKSTSRKPPEDVEWDRVTVPGFWEHQGYSNYDGSAWYRKQFYVPKELQGEDLVLFLGKIDDHDETYFNGKFVGATYQHDRTRGYHIPASLITAGALNLILIYVDDTGGEGGIYDGPIGLIKQSEYTRYIRWRD